MRLFDLFFSGNFSGNSESSAAKESPLAPAQAAKTAFEKLTGGKGAIAEAVRSCASDTEAYFRTHPAILARRGMHYSPEAEPWLLVIAAVEAAEDNGFLRELDAGCPAEEFTAALQAVLAGRGIEFSLKNILFDSKMNLTAWVERFNEYAGQSGITLYFVDLYGSRAPMGASTIADYAEAAEIAGSAGIAITSRPVFGDL